MHGRHHCTENTTDTFRCQDSSLVAPQQFPMAQASMHWFKLSSLDSLSEEQRIERSWTGGRWYRCLHDQDYLGLPHQRHRRKPLRFVEDRSGSGTCQWCDLLGLEASLKGSMVVFVFDYYRTRCLRTKGHTFLNLSFICLGYLIV
jgi:hypothetical protein